MALRIHPYPDELVMSMVARYHMYSDRCGVKESLRDVYGLESARPSIHLPAHLQRLGFSTYFCVTAENLVLEHTLFPYYAAFWKPEIATRVMNDMLSDNSLGIHLESGLVPSKISMPTRPVLCPACIQYDMQMYGETYWHRAHHLPGVMSCPKHRVKLYDRCPACGVSFVGSSIQELPIPAAVCPHGHSLLKTEVETCAEVNRIAMDSEFVLNTTAPWKTPEELRERYANALYTIGVATPSGSIRQRELYERFSTHFPAALWDKIGVPKPVTDREWDWLRELTRKPRKALHPLFHILLMEFIGGDAVHFFERSPFEPFGHGPWPCLNKAAPHYMEDVVRGLTVTICSDTRLPVGTFRCECGFVYSRRGPDRTKEDRTRYGRIKVFGHVWEERLRTLASENRLSLRGLARELGTDPKVIKVRLTKCGGDNLSACQGGNTEHEERKARFLRTLRANPKCSRSDLRRLNYRDYHWLYRHDPEWLYSVLPPPLSSGARSVRRVDWARRDRDLAVLVERTAESICNSPGKPAWVTVSRIGRLCDKQALIERCLDKLPLTKLALDKYVENRSAFYRRRIDWAIMDLLRSRQDVSTWQVARRAGLRTPLSGELVEYTEQRLIRALGNKGGF